MARALREWLDSHGLPAIIAAVLGVIVLPCRPAGVGGYCYRDALNSSRRRSDMLRHDLAGPRVRTGLDIDRP